MASTKEINEDISIAGQEKSSDDFIRNFIYLAKSDKLDDMQMKLSEDRNLALGVIKRSNWSGDNSFKHHVSLYYRSFGSPLYWAIVNDNQFMVDFLLDNGADVDAKNTYRGGGLEESPFFQAVRGNHEAMAIQLLRYGANPYLKDKKV